MYIFEAIDQEGVEVLEAESFCEFDGMIFRKSVFARASVKKLLASGLDRATLQARVNHQSLISYGGSLDQQRSAASRITSTWLKKATEEFADLYPTVIVESSPQEVLISIRAMPRKAAT